MGYVVLGIVLIVIVILIFGPENKKTRRQGSVKTGYVDVGGFLSDTGSSDSSDGGCGGDSGGGDSGSCGGD